eukprot:360999-Chlamydomonas_euryale.AAC.13
MVGDAAAAAVRLLEGGGNIQLEAFCGGMRWDRSGCCCGGDAMVAMLVAVVVVVAVGGSVGGSGRGGGGGGFRGGSGSNDDGGVGGGGGVVVVASLVASSAFRGWLVGQLPIHIWGQNDWVRCQMRTFDEGVSTHPPRQRPSHLVILTGIPTCTTAHWAVARSQRAATIPVIEAFNPCVNWV